MRSAGELAPTAPRPGLWIAGALGVLAASGLFVYQRLAGNTPASVPETVATDERIAWLLAPCGFTLPFAADTSDMVKVLVETLARGQSDPLKHARAELATLGPSVLPELERRFDASYAQAFEQGILENVLGVVTIAEDNWGLELLRRGIRHPGESVRMGALAGLERHGGPADYDAAYLCLALTQSPQTQAQIIDSLRALDPERFGQDLLGWLERDEYSTLWSTALLWVGEIHAEASVRALAAQAERQPEHMRPYLLAPAARDGDEAALSSLRMDLGNATPSVREHALRALGLVGLAHELHVVLELDTDRKLRLQAANLIADLPADPTVNAWLTQGLSDPDFDVRSACLQALCRRGDPRALAEALEGLRGDLRLREQGIVALRPAWDSEPGLPDRAFEFLQALLEDRMGGDLDGYANLLQLISQVPGERSARFLAEQARSLEGRIHGWRAHRFCIHQAINTGPLGRAYLRTLLPGEADPLRRIDLLEAITQDTGPEVRGLLRALIDDPQINPYERVYASYRLIRQGDWVETAPYLKRVYLASSDAVVRPALHCLLWAWYGAANER